VFVKHAMALATALIGLTDITTVVLAAKGVLAEAVKTTMQHAQELLQAVTALQTTV
jgi:hypothetical protein